MDTFINTDIDIGIDIDTGIHKYTDAVTGVEIYLDRDLYFILETIQNTSPER